MKTQPKQPVHTKGEKLKIPSVLPYRKTLHGLWAIRIENRKGEWVADAIGDDEGGAILKAQRIIKSMNVLSIIEKSSKSTDGREGLTKLVCQQLLKQAEQK